MKNLNNHHAHKVLGIDPGTRETGFAVIGHMGLIDYGVKSFKDRMNRKKLLTDAKKWLSKLIAFHRPKVIVIEKSNLTRLKSSKNLRYLIAQIERTAKRHKLKVVQMTPNTVRKILLGDGWGTKKETAKFIARERFPELSKFTEHRRNAKWRDEYWSNMFDAVSLALAYREKRRKRRAQPSHPDLCRDGC